jgi:hypothetical protein
MSTGIIRTGWIGTSGGPGLTQLAVNTSETDQTPLTAAQAQSAVNAVRGFWDAIKALIPNEITLTVSPIVDQYRYYDGVLHHTVTSPTTPAVVVGTASSTYAMASGMKVNLNTEKISGGRRVRGAIYVVPCASSAFSDLGNVTTGTRSTVNTAADAMRLALVSAGMNLMVWSRPTIHGASGSSDGELSVVTACETNEKGAILRGRRD